MTRPRLLDLFCCQGGAGEGYRRAGFDVIGVDINPQPRYPLPFVQADALAYLAKHGRDFDVIHASPPCQRWTKAQRIRANDHPDLIAPTRDLLADLGVPYVIENVEDARGELIDPVMLCGRSFPELAVYRHRLFESNIPLEVPDHLPHDKPLRKMGRRPLPGEFMHVVGNFSGVEQGRAAMGGVDWMTRDGLRESIPPAYSEFIGAQLLAHLEAVAA